MTMQMQLQRQRGDGSGSRTARRARQITPTTRRRHPACRRSARRFVAEWLNRDPIEERGGLNLYGFVNNSPCNFNDPFGLLVSPPGYSDGVLTKCAQRAADAYKDCANKVNNTCKPIGNWLDMFGNNLDSYCATAGGGFSAKGIVTKALCFGAKLATRTAKAAGGAFKTGALTGCASNARNEYIGCLNEHTPPGQSLPIYPTPPGG